MQLEYEPGLTHVRVPSARSTIVHRLACARLREAGGPAYWIDARNAASTHALYDCAESERVLAGLEVARAFTAYQHHSLAREVARVADDPTLVVAPNVADLYRDDDLRECEREDLLAATVSTLRELGRALECPVLVTTAGDAPDAVEERADAAVDCVRTREGIRLEGDGASTDGYHRGDYWQTTIPYWVAIRGALEGDPAAAIHDRGLLASEPAVETDADAGVSA